MPYPRNLLFIWLILNTGSVGHFPWLRSTGAELSAYFTAYITTRFFSSRDKAMTFTCCFTSAWVFSSATVIVTFTCVYTIAVDQVRFCDFAFPVIFNCATNIATCFAGSCDKAMTFTCCFVGVVPDVDWQPLMIPAAASASATPVIFGANFGFSMINSLCYIYIKLNYWIVGNKPETEFCVLSRCYYQQDLNFMALITK